MSTWVHKSGRATIAIDRDAFSAALAPFADDLNKVAYDVAGEARKILPTEDMAKFIGVKPAAGESGTWTLKLRGRAYGSGTGDRLGRGLRVPIALITNDSRLAMLWEYGGVPQEALKVIRTPGSKKGATKSATSGEMLLRQYQPLTLAAQKVGARLVLRYRQSKGSA